MRKLIGFSKPAGWLAAVLILLGSTVAFPQDAGTRNTAEKSATDTQPGGISKRPKKPTTPPTLTDATRVSTAEAARSVALEAAKKHTTDQDSRHASEGTVESDVLEFRPAAQDSEREAASHPSISTRPTRKNIHGTVSGSLDPKNSGYHHSETAVGLGSKSDKTHVYVETDQSRSALPTSH